jgi:hypothetical protein
MSLYLPVFLVLTILAMTQPANCADLQLQAATYLGGSQADEASAIDIAPDKTIIFAGTIQGNNFGKTPITLLNGGNGVIIRFNSTGTEVLSVTRIGGSVDDMEIDRTTGQIAVSGDFGAALLSPNADKILWHKTLDPAGGGAVTSPGRRIAVGGKGTVAALHGKAVTVFDQKGQQMGDWKLSNSYVEDVAIDETSQSVFVVGFDNKRLSSANTGCPGCPVQVAFMFSYGYDGNR